MIANDNYNMLNDVRNQLMKYKTTQATTSDSWKLYVSTINARVSYAGTLIYKCIVEFHYDTSNPCVVMCYAVNNSNFAYSSMLGEAPGIDNRHRFYADVVHSYEAGYVEDIDFVAISTQPGYLTYEVSTRPY